VIFGDENNTHISDVTARVFSITDDDVIGHDVIVDEGHELANHLEERPVDL